MVLKLPFFVYEAAMKRHSANRGDELGINKIEISSVYICNEICKTIIR